MLEAKLGQQSSLQALVSIPLEQGDFTETQMLATEAAFMNKNKASSDQINTLFSWGHVLIPCNYGNQITQESNLPKGTGYR